MQWLISYKGGHNISGDYAALPAIGQLAKQFPELAWIQNFIVDINDESRTIVIREIEDKAALREELRQKTKDIMSGQSIKRIDSATCKHLAGYGAGYVATLALHAEMTLDEAIRVKRIEILRGLVDETLVSGNQELFMQYSKELKELLS